MRLPEQTMFSEIIKRLKAWYLGHYGIELSYTKLAEQVTQRTGRRAYVRTMLRIEGGKMPAWDIANALIALDAEWLCKSTRGVDESLETAA